MSVNTFEKIINNLNIDTSKVPKHIAVIMDGNGRWAKKRKLPRIAGHRKGAKNVTNIVEAAGEIGVKFMTIYTFSIENWNRPKKEVDSLMNLFEEVLTAKLPQLMKKSVRLNLIGDLSSIPETTRKKFNDAVDKTSKNDGLVLTVALNYGGRDEITRAINKMLKNGVRQVDEETVSKYLDTNNLPDPELVIRTSGESRISNFLLWQIAYSEVYKTPTLWPDFKPEHLYEAIKDFQKRKRRFGGL